ncbi:MAG: LysE family transporter [Bacteroidaceae bacterium]|nr:LysE family transporter [Bacteroidaceae bacterium]
MGVFADYISTFQLVIKGLLIGIICSAPMGPVGILCIRRTLQKGRDYGLATGAGAALSDLFYALVTGAGMLPLMMEFIDNEHNLFYLKIVGALMLFAFGVWMWRTDPRKGYRPSKSDTKGTLLSNAISAFGLTISNPLIIFLFIALFNMFTFVIPGNWYGTALGYTSIVGGAMLWWYGLTYVITKMKRAFDLHGILILNRTIGTIVLTVAVLYAAMTIFHFSFTN